MIRPIYHLQPLCNWMNDPNGPVFIGDIFHMFYQHNPYKAEWGNMTWGHAVSPDMVHWRHRQHALRPDQPYDRQGVFSGCCVMHEGRPHIFYTGVYPETVCLAIGDEQGSEFTKYADNPIITTMQSGLSGWRDPFIWKEPDGYRLILGSASKGKGCWVEIYRSTDLLHWDPIGSLIGSSAETADSMWECPTMMLEAESEAALFISALPSFTTRVMLGRYSDNHFVPHSIQDHDLGDCLYAPNMTRHPDGRMIQYAWLRECGDEKMRMEQGWQGMLSIPRELELRGGRLVVQPAREVELLRKTVLMNRYGFSITTGEDVLSGIRGQHLDIELECCLFGGALSLDLLRKDDENRVGLYIDDSHNSIMLDMNNLSGGIRRKISGEFCSSEYINLRILVDGTSIEVFINSHEVLTTRAYPDEYCDSMLLSVHQDTYIENLRVYSMGSAYYE